MCENGYNLDVTFWFYFTMFEQFYFPTFNFHDKNGFCKRHTNMSFSRIFI
jgi:hypothetical protein